MKPRKTKASTPPIRYIHWPERLSFQASEGSPAKRGSTFRINPGIPSKTKAVSRYPVALCGYQLRTRAIKYPAVVIVIISIIPFGIHREITADLGKCD